MAINPTADKYIADLLASNKQDFALLYKVDQRIKKLKSERFACEPLGLTPVNVQKVANLTAEILSLYDEKKHIRSCINGRLEEIAHVKEVAKHGA